MTWEELLALADKLEPEARQKFLDAIAQLRDDIDLDKLARAIARGDALTADQILNENAFREDLAGLLDVVQTAMINAGKAEAVALAAQLGTSLRFDITNPAAVQFARDAAADLVTNIDTETTLALRNIVTRAFAEGLTARDTAALIRPLIGLTNRDAMAVVNYRFNLLDSGVPLARVELLSAQYAAKLLRDRALTIARTEIMAASNAGQHAMWLQAVEQGLLPSDQKVRWIVTPDDRLCPRCRAMKNQIRGLNEPFVCPLDGTEVLFPPLHPRCRCVRVLVSAKDLRLVNGVLVYYKEAA